MALANPTQTRIYNRAHSLLGSVNRSVSPDDGKPWTETLNELWPQAVRDLTAEHPWNHAIGRAVLNKGPAPEWGEGYTYQLPSDCVRWLPPASTSEEYFEGVREGNAIIADEDDTIKIRYIKLILDVTLWPPHFVTAMGYRLAMDGAEAITQSRSIFDEMVILYQGSDGHGGALGKAKLIDGLETGDRERGDVRVRSRALSAGYGQTYQIPNT